MPVGHGEYPQPRWHYEELPYDTINREALAGDRLLFYMLATASFVEITSDLYTQNLIDYFEGDPQVQSWLAHSWEPEELQHGRALRHYVNGVWPKFDWDDTYRRFVDEYAQCCRVELLGPTRALEMARRCIVETGTCSYYTMISRLAPCAVLKQLAAHIRTDEAGHYRHFHEFFLHYRAAESPSRAAILKSLVGRIREINGEDGLIAFKHVWLSANPGARFRRRDYRRFIRAVSRLAIEHYPFRMAAHMASQPLGLSFKVQRRTDATLATAARAAARVTGRTAEMH